MKKITSIERERINVLDVQGTHRKWTVELRPPTMKIIEQKNARIFLNQILGLSTLSDSTVSYTMMVAFASYSSLLKFN